MKTRRQKIRFMPFLAKLIFCGWRMIVGCGCGLLGCQEASAQVTVPGRIEAENYDTNGPGISYYDVSTGNNGGVYRSDDVDIESTTDTGGGYDVGWISAGEWLTYTVNVQETAVYQLAFRVAALSSGGAIQVSLDGLPLCGVQTPQTGGWQSWQTVTVSNLVLRAGQRLLRLDFQTGGYNLNYVQIAKQKSLTGGFLRASGKQIVDGQGQNVVLRGMGFGNWMLQEPYMMDVSGIADTQLQLKSKIAELVGTDNMNAFYTAWLTNYTGPADVEALAGAGFNSIRLPLHYALFTLPVDQEPVPGQNTWLETGFNLVNDLLGWCQTNHIYLVLDMHGCPGGQGRDQPISDYNPPAPSLWESAANRDKLIALWREIARRYATNQWIGAYDLINEPNWTFENRSDIHGGSDQTNAPLRQLMVDLTVAIRQADTNHLLILEGNGWGNNYAGILPPWDPNLGISFHKYWDQPTAASFQGRIDMRDQWNMPLWLGETGENSNEWFRDVVRWCEQFNIGWSWWPWKKIAAIAGPVTIKEPVGYQNILNYWRNTGPRPSTNDAFNSLLEFAQATRFENCILHPDVLDALIRPYPLGATLPFKNHSAPGIIFGADYDLGRQGEAYYDTTTTNNYNSGGSYRNDSVDIESTSDPLPSIGYNVGWLDPGDWMKYTVTPLVPGSYAVYARVAGGSSGGSFYLDVGGSNVTGTITVPATGGWQAWTTIPAGTITNAEFTSFKVVVVSPGFNLNWITLETVPGSTAGLPPGWSDQDVGSPGVPGSAAMNTNTGMWAVNGAGADIWGTLDQFNFASKDFTGDGTILARVTGVAKTGAHPKAGVMLRESNNSNASYAFAYVGTNSTGFECRNGAGTSSFGVGTGTGGTPQWVKLTRSGNNFNGYTSPDGVTWTLLGARTIVMSPAVKGGLAVSANNNSALNTATMDNVSLEASATSHAPPLLAVNPGSSAGELTFSWPSWATGFALYSTTNLAPPIVWLPVTNTAVNHGVTFGVTVPVGNRSEFFSLFAP